LADEGFEVVGVQIGEFSPDLEAVLVLWVADEVHRHVFDDSHVLRYVAASQPGEIVVEHDVEHPVQAVLDAPVGADRGGEALGVEGE